MRRIRLLLVEDDVHAADGLKLALDEHGFHVRVVHFGRETVGVLIHEQMDVLILDLTLPDIDGAVVGEIVRRGWPDLPIVITSGHEKPERIAPLLAGRRTAYLRKPYTIDALIDVIRHS